VRKRTADNHSNLLDTFGNRRTMTPFDTKLVFGIESYVRIAPEAVVRYLGIASLFRRALSKTSPPKNPD
jgi:hypothetical protein